MQKIYEDAVMAMAFLIRLGHDIEYSSLKVGCAYNLLTSKKLQKQFKKLNDLEIAIKDDKQMMEIIEKAERGGYKFDTNFAENLQSYFSELKKAIEEAKKNGKENEPCINVLHPERVDYIR